MTKTIAAVVLMALAACMPALPTASAGFEILPCTATGSQGTIVTVPYYATIYGTGWEGSEYHVYGGYSYEDVDRWNYCVAGFQVGAVNARYSHSTTWDSCVNCLYVESLLA